MYEERAASHVVRMEVGGAYEGHKKALEHEIILKLRTCYDPEIPVNVYELGLIYEIQIADDGKVDIKMTLTSPMCPVAETLPPEVGGKVWGAVVKEPGHEFVYRSEVMKVRNISLRGPWTSGGIEFTFGVIGPTPATATPVDYVLRENDDGSVSCIVGAMDLPSRST